MAVTKKRLAALRKELAALKKKRRAKTARKKPAKKRVAKKRAVKRTYKKRPKKRVAKKRARKQAPKRRAKKKRADNGAHIYARKGTKGKRYYLQKVKGEWNFKARKPRGFNAKELRSAKTAVKRLAAYLPAGYSIYINAKKKR